MAGMDYPTTEQITEGARILTLCYPGVCRLERVGSSRAGRPLLMLSVGHRGRRPGAGDRNVLVVAGPHANEAAVGGATALRLARTLAYRRAAGDDDGSDWYFLLCVDP